MEDIFKIAFARGYAKGYLARIRDTRKAKVAKKRFEDKCFKKELDIIDDVRQSKWA